MRFQHLTKLTLEDPLPLNRYCALEVLPDLCGLYNVVPVQFYCRLYTSLFHCPNINAYFFPGVLADFDAFTRSFDMPAVLVESSVLLTGIIVSLIKLFTESDCDMIQLQGQTYVRPSWNVDSIASYSIRCVNERANKK